MRWPWSKPTPPIYYCEVCGRPGVERSGVWDYCDYGHTYVGKRVDA